MSVIKKIGLGVGLVILLAAILSAVLAYLLIHRTPGNYLDAEGVRIYYTDEGRGDPVILIHGVAANADWNWRRPGVTRMLAKNFRVISFDLRGHGLSDKPASPEAYGSQLVRDIVRIMDHLDIETAHIAGYSLGGFLALKACTTYPERIRSAAICAAGWKDPEDPSPIPNPYQSPPPEIVEASPLLPAASKSVWNRIRNRVGDYFMDANAKKAMKKNYAELAVSRTELEQCPVPIFCIVGLKDGFLPLARALTEVHGNVDYHEIRGAGHFSLPFTRVFKKHLEHFFLKKP